MSFERTDMKRKAGEADLTAVGDKYHTSVGQQSNVWKIHCGILLKAEVRNTWRARQRNQLVELSIDMLKIVYLLETSNKLLIKII